MAWLTVQSLQSGFNDYLKEKQSQELKILSASLAQYYVQNGDFSGLRHRPHLVRQLIDQSLGREAPPVDEVSPNERAFSPLRREPDAPAPLRPRRIEMGGRISLLDERGDPVFGPLRSDAQVMREAVVVQGRTVATLIAPLPQFALESTTSDFIRKQIKQILWLALALITLAMGLGLWLGKHLVKPIAGLRQLTREIAHGRLEARATVETQDEIGELARHINAMAQALQHSDQKRKKVMADLSHELRTPLTVMRAEVEALIDGVRPLNQDAILSLNAEIHHLKQLIDDLHQLALADAGDLHFNFEMIDVLDLVRQVGKRFKTRFESAQLRLQFDFPNEAIFVHADQGRLTQVLENLLENSLRYTDAPGEVQLSLNVQSGQSQLVQIVIADSAPTVEPAQLDKIFDRLFRADAARFRASGASGGSGLGLSICRSIILAHQGEIKATQSGLGGIAIHIVLPKGK